MILLAKNCPKQDKTRINKTIKPVFLKNTFSGIEKSDKRLNGIGESKLLIPRVTNGVNKRRIHIPMYTVGISILFGLKMVREPQEKRKMLCRNEYIT